MEGNIEGVEGGSGTCREKTKGIPGLGVDGEIKVDGSNWDREQVLICGEVLSLEEL
jgi:hypothetical protein